ncbi:MAG: trypsin-like peptidase domain-containing protein [Candidatus Thermoplasmatota archaeon]|nr:trypsin-like peptidase domain-containing protein [Candidatus Thermoplasmatota archaeon]
MYEVSGNTRKSRNTYLAAFVAFFVVAMFIAGYFVGGSYSSSATTSEFSLLDQQLDTLQEESDNEVTLTTTYYYYNTTSLGALYQSVEDSVVVITGVVQQYSFFGLQVATVQGSGFVYSYNGDMVVITNNHVVDSAMNITVTFSNGNGYPASVIGADAYADLAILDVQAPADEFQPLKITSSSDLQVGDPVIAIGSPFGLGGTMTTGIVSQLGRTIQESTAGSYPIANIIQTSVPINPGNSGGPLLNYRGEVIGITTAIIEDSNGLGFAIPSSTILREIDLLISTGSYDQHSWLGVAGVDMKYSIASALGEDVTYGWLLTQVTRGGAADTAGLQGGTRQMKIYDEWVTTGGDIIIAVDGTRIIDGDCLMSYLEEHTSPGQIITLTVIRDHEPLNISVTLGQRPPAT